jgi:hypothetical protein
MVISELIKNSLGVTGLRDVPQSVLICVCAFVADNRSQGQSLSPGWRSHRALAADVNPECSRTSVDPVCDSDLGCRWQF